MPKAKKFIDKKKSVSFHLVHRSQQDPLIADENAPQHVLAPANINQPAKNEKRIEEQRKFGVYFDDEYNYLQHLKDPGQNSVEWEPIETGQGKQSLQLPSSVFASKIEEDVGLLNKAAPRSGLQLDLDPDIVAAMDEDFDYDNPDNLIEDNFIELAETAIDDDNEDIISENDFSSEFEDDDDSSENDEQVQKKETRSRFSDCSLSSSVLPRNRNLRIIDERFEQMLAKYDNDDSEEDCKGLIDNEELEEFIKNNPLEKNVRYNLLEPDKSVREVTLQLAEKISLDEMNGVENLETIKIPQKPKYNCVSILSTYSNLYHHPRLLEIPKKKKIQISSKTGLPTESGKLTAKNLKQLNNDNSQRKNDDYDEDCETTHTLSQLSFRDKNETPEEKLKRKRDLKEYRKIRRIIRKENKTIYKNEKVKLEKTEANKTFPSNSKHYA